MDLLERINDTLPDAVWGNEEDVVERMEALADQHAIGFLKWVHDYCDWHKGRFYRYDGTDRTFDEMLSIYKIMYPDGY